MSASDCSSGLVYTQAAVIAETNVDKRKCLCALAPISDISNNLDIRNICWDAYVENALRIFFSVIGAFVIIIVNTILRIVLKKLGKFERYTSLTKEATSTAFRIFAAMFFNTAILTILMHGNIFGVVVAIEITYPIYPVYLKQDAFISN